TAPVRPASAAPDRSGAAAPVARYLTEGTGMDLSPDRSCSRLPPSHQQIFDFHRQFAYTNTGGVVNRLCDGGSDPSQSDLSNAARSELVDFSVGIIQKVHLDRRRVGVYRHHVVSQVAVDGRAVLRIVDGLFEHRHANAHDHRALNLIPGGKRIHDPPGIHHADDTADAQSGDLLLPGDLDEVAAE